MFRYLRYARNEVLVIGLGIGLAEGLLEHERPLDLFEPTWLLALGLCLIGVGVSFRVAALGCIRKNEQLEAAGVYSLCRHPLYLGTMLAYTGFCILLDDAEFWYFGAAYFGVFYTVLIRGEEAYLSRAHPEEHARYRRSTPLLLPLGTFRPGRFAWSRARQRGALGLIAAVLMMLGAVEVMARCFRPEAMGGNDPPDSLVGIVHER